MGHTVKTYLLVSEKSWHDAMFSRLQDLVSGNWIRIFSKDKFNFEYLSCVKPDKIFLPHWSYIIKPEIYNNYECVVFHMTDLPFGRGGSPLQNLIVRGFEETKISALRVADGIDTGDVYLKSLLTLDGSAEQILKRATKVMEQMIVEIATRDIQPIPQTGEVVEFKRRRPEQSNIAGLDEPKAVYDYIRMLDCEGYPHAYLETASFKFEFTEAILNSDQSVTAHVRIIKK